MLSQKLLSLQSEYGIRGKSIEELKRMKMETSINLALVIDGISLSWLIENVESLDI